MAVAKVRPAKKEKLAVTPEAAKKLRTVAKHILEEPLRLYMDNWVLDVKKSSYFAEEVEDFNGALPPCGTVACIAGWTVMLFGLQARLPLRASMYLGSACDILDLDEFSPLGMRLFHTSDWPTKYMDQYVLARTAKGRARVTAERIEHFIHTGK